MSKTTIARGNLLRANMIQVKLTPTVVGTAASSEQTFTIQDLATTDMVEVNSNAAQTQGIGIGNARVSAANTLAIQFTNAQTVAETPVVGLYNILVFRCEDNPPPANTI